MRSTRSRRKDQFSPPTSKQYSSQHELPVRVVPRGGRRTVSVSKKSQQSRRHLTCERERERERERFATRKKRARARAERERETEGKEEESPRTGLHAGLADVDGNNLSHFWWCCSWWFFLGMCSGKETKRLMSLRVLLERGKSANFFSVFFFPFEMRRDQKQTKTLN